MYSSDLGGLQVGNGLAHVRFLCSGEEIKGVHRGGCLVDGRRMDAVRGGKLLQQPAKCDPLAGAEDGKEVLVVVVSNARECGQHSLSGSGQCQQLRTVVALAGAAQQPLSGLQLVQHFRDGAAGHAHRVSEHRRGDSGMPVNVDERHPFRHRKLVLLQSVGEGPGDLIGDQSKPVAEMDFQWICRRFGVQAISHGDFPRMGSMETIMISMEPICQIQERAKTSGAAQAVDCSSVFAVALRCCSRQSSTVP